MKNAQADGRTGGCGRQSDILLGTDEFILKIMVPKVAEKVTVNFTEKVNATENVIDASQKTSQKIIDLIKEDPYISTSKMAEIIGVDRRNIARNIKKLQEQGVVRRVGPDKGGLI